MAKQILDGVVKVVTGIILLVATKTYSDVQDVRTDIGVLNARMEAVTERVNHNSGMEGRLRLIESNRFTSQDAMKMWEEITVMKTRLPSSFPPPETQAVLDRIEKRLEVVEAWMRERK